MNNPIYSSQRQKLAKEKMRQLYKEGKWPPVGHPLRALALLEPKVVEDFFRGAVWSALSQGLERLKDNAMHVVLRDPNSGMRDEARGIVNTCEDIVEWADDVRAFHDAIKEEPNQ